MNQSLIVKKIRRFGIRDWWNYLMDSLFYFWFDPTILAVSVFDDSSMDCCPWQMRRATLPTAEILSGKTAWAFLVCGFLRKIIQKNILKIWQKLRETFGSYMLNSTANPAHFHSNWAGLAVHFSRQLLNSSQDFLLRFDNLIFIYFFKYKTIETHDRSFLLLNISAVGSVVLSVSLSNIPLRLLHYKTEPKS